MAADPDLQIREGPGHPDPEMGVGRGQSENKIFSALQASVWSYNKGGGGAGPPWAPPLDPPLRTAEEHDEKKE